MIRTAARNVREHAVLLVLAALSAGLAYGIASVAFGPEGAFFAPIAAVICTGLTVGQRRRRAVEIALGVFLGGAVAQVLVWLAGPGVWQLACAVFGAVVIAASIRPSTLLVNQAAVAAVVVMAVGPILEVPSWIRLADAVIGGAVALTLTSLYPGHPDRILATSARRFVDDYAAILNQVADAVETESIAASNEALERVPQLQRSAEGLSEALSNARERMSSGMLLLPRKERVRARTALSRATALSESAELMTATARALCRAAGNLVRHPHGGADRRLAEALQRVARTASRVPEWAAGTADVARLRAAVLDVAEDVSAIRDDTSKRHRSASHTRTVLVMQIRSAVVDILAATGWSRTRAIAELEARAGRSDQLCL